MLAELIGGGRRIDSRPNRFLAAAIDLIGGGGRIDWRPNRLAAGAELISGGDGMMLDIRFRRRDIQIGQPAVVRQDVEW